MKGKWRSAVGGWFRAGGHLPWRQCTLHPTQPTEKVMHKTASLPPPLFLGGIFLGGGGVALRWGPSQEDEEEFFYRSLWEWHGRVRPRAESEGGRKLHGYGSRQTKLIFVYLFCWGGKTWNSWNSKLAISWLKYQMLDFLFFHFIWENNVLGGREGDAGKWLCGGKRWFFVGKGKRETLKASERSFLFFWERL